MDLMQALRKRRNPLKKITSQFKVFLQKSINVENLNIISYRIIEYTKK
jgi:hypothetical protein